MMTLRILDEAQMRELYDQQMCLDFPPSELKTLDAIVSMMRAGVYDVFGAYMEESLIAYALCYRPKEGGVVLLDYLGVVPDMRRKGVGTALLHMLRSHYAPLADTLLIECERPKTAPDEMTARKRIDFYTEAGAQLTDVRIWLFDVEYSILTLPCKKESVPRDWAKQMLALYRQMLTPQRYEENVRLIRG